MSVLMACAAAASLVVPGSGTGEGGGKEASYVDASVRVEGELLDWSFVDVDQDGQAELALSLRSPRGDRELQLHRTTAVSIDPKPFREIAMLKDIVSWTFADVRPDLDGRELVLLTRQGAWSFDPRRSSYRGNIERLLSTDLLYDVPSTRDLPYWKYVLDPYAGSERLLLPRRGGFEIFGPRPGGTDEEVPWGMLHSYQNTAGFAPIDPEDQERQREKAESDNDRRRARFSATIGDTLRPFLGEGLGQSLLDDSVTLQAPAVVDVNSDGRRDMLLLDGNLLRVYLATASGIPSSPTRVEELPEYLRRDGQRASLRIADIDGDGDMDVLGIWREKIKGFENGQWRVFVMRSSRDRLIPAEPTQVLRFEGAALRTTVADVDGDGRPDLAIRRFQVPSMIETVTGLEFRFAHLLYLGKKNGTFDKKPALRDEKTYDEESIAEIIANRELVMDCSGDGIADLVEVDLKGRLAVRRLRKDSSFFGGSSWKIDGAPWKQYASRGSVESLAVTDLNDDKLGDIVSASRSVLTVYLSQWR
ncbi:MAG: VCBS repeat-containing protein [Planctomycetota bacterium]